ncbi:multiple coagulation factor deficiency protein 2 homolog isoform X2 [Apostichopus japonicus]|uniref:multiple coagulation factor deficiency protein 2 homolog isoform X2 n=1 Tax=Stichopus japonicus TaxID=307972 RepID=UPI003AB40404
MMKVFFFVVATIAIVAAQNNEVPVQQQQGVPVQNQGQQQIKIDHLNQEQQVQLQQQQILAQQQLQQQQQQQQMEQQPQGQHGVVNNVAGGGGRNLIRDKTHIQDREHIKLHLNGVIDQDGQDMSEKELELHYFKMHDYDNNMKLDGLEIMQAVSHFHHEGASDDSTPLDDDELMRLIDPILEEDDKNKDGFVDYPEFAANKV